MSGRSFSLKPFKIKPPPNVKITGTVGRSNNTFSISYAVQGSLPDIMVPAPEDKPSRKWGLWEETCLEFFLAAKNARGYWEFNLSPSGHWNVYRFASYRKGNVYRFASYRKGMKEETAFASLPFRVRREPDSLGLSLELPLNTIIPADKALKVAVSAVIKTTDGRTAYWALTHPAPQPDFHRRDSFILGL
jgi:hypothetical protein